VPAADPDAGTVRCGASSCGQSGHEVLPPIEGGECGSGSWERLDAGDVPLLACVPAAQTRIAGSIAMPDLAGARLDLAEDYLDRLGAAHDTSGGGAFGIVVRDRWVVCTTTPPAGETLAQGDAATLFVDRSC
jgi:hypothetical protein